MSGWTVCRVQRDFTYYLVAFLVQNPNCAIYNLLFIPVDALK
jgi:hypothetical protein